MYLFFIPIIKSPTDEYRGHVIHFSNFLLLLNYVIIANIACVILYMSEMCHDGLFSQALYQIRKLEFFSMICVQWKHLGCKEQLYSYKCWNIAQYYSHFLRKKMRNRMKGYAFYCMAFLAFIVKNVRVQSYTWQMMMCPCTLLPLDPPLPLLWGEALDRQLEPFPHLGPACPDRGALLMCCPATV